MDALRVAVISAHTSPLATPGCRETGGMNVYVRELSREMGRRGYVIDIFTRRADVSSADVLHPYPNVRVVHIRSGPPEDGGKRNLCRHLGEFEQDVLAFQRSEGLKYDLIHAHYWLSGWVGLSLRERWGVPLLAMAHTLGEVKRRLGMAEPEPPCRIEVERLIAARADGLICASDDERRVLEDCYGADPDHIRVIPCGVDLLRFRQIDREAARRFLSLNGEKMVLFVGRIEAAKGIELLLSAAAELAAEPPFQVLIVGGDGTGNGEIERLRGVALGLGLERRVSFMGPVEHDRLPLFYNAADVCVVPSLHESFGLVALEAMACGTPVVASDVGGLRETVKDGETGYLIAGRSPQPFARRITSLLADDALRRSLGRTARREVTRFGWGNIADAIETAYADVRRERAQAATGSRAIAV